MIDLRLLKAVDMKLMSDRIDRGMLLFLLKVGEMIREELISNAPTTELTKIYEDSKVVLIEEGDEPTVGLVNYGDQKTVAAGSDFMVSYVSLGKSPLVDYLASLNPWPGQMIPYQPLGVEGWLLRKRISVSEHDALLAEKTKNRAAIEAKLISLGLRWQVSAQAEVVDDYAFDILRNEFGSGGKPSFRFSVKSVLTSKLEVAKAAFLSYCSGESEGVFGLKNPDRLVGAKLSDHKAFNRKLGVK